MLAKVGTVQTLEKNNTYRVMNLNNRNTYVMNIFLVKKS